jgi:hypothetical protein
MIEEDEAPCETAVAALGTDLGTKHGEFDRTERDVHIGYDCVVGTIDQAAGWSRFGEPPYSPVRRLPAVAAKLEQDRRMTESSDTSDTPAKPEDYAGLRAELAMLVDDFSPVINELWPRLHPCPTRN